MKDSSHLISVLMTAYNREKYLEEAIESVLASTYTNFELIIVDDGSTDNTVKIARSYEAKDDRVKVYVNEKKLGDYPNRNKAASYAKGEYIKYLDSDDIIYPHGLEVMVRSMEQFPEGGLGLCSVSDPIRPYPVCLSPHDAYWEHFNGYGFFNRAPGAAIIKRIAFENIGGFSGKRFIGDTELWFKLASRFPIVKFPRDLVWDRTHTEAEKVYEQKEKSIETIRADLIKSFLKDKSCPLNEEEILSIEKNLNKNRFVNRTKSLLKNLLRH